MGVKVIQSTHYFDKVDMKEIQTKVKEILTKGGLAIEHDAKEMAPVRTGNLRASITTNVVDDSTVEVGTNVEYAPFVEYGIRQNPQPYLYPAYEANRQTIEDELSKVLGGK